MIRGIRGLCGIGTLGRNSLNFKPKIANHAILVAKCANKYQILPQSLNLHAISDLYMGH